MRRGAGSALDAADCRLFSRAGRVSGAKLPRDPRGTSRDLDIHIPTGHPAYSPLAIADDGTLLAGTHEGFLYAIRDVKPALD